MNLQTLFKINFVIALFFGVSCGIFASWVLKLYGIEPTSALIWTTRLAGGSILGFSSLMWFGAGAASYETRRVIAFALLIQDMFGLIASLEILLSGSINILGWSNPFIYGLLAVGYAYFLFIKPSGS